MKKTFICFALLVLIGFGSAKADHFGDVTVGTWLNIPFEAIDTSSGTSQTPDSVWVMVWFGNQANGLAYSVRGTAASEAWWDTVQVGTGDGAEQNFFFDMVGDIDADSGAGLYVGQIVAWKETKPFRTPFSFSLVDSAINTMLTRIGDAHEVAQGAKDKTDSLNFQGVAAGAGLAVDVTRVSGDTSAANNLERAIDGDSTTWAWKFQVRQFQVIADAGNNNAMYLSGFGTGSGIYGTSAGNGFGANLMGNTNSGLQVGCLSGPCVGASIFGVGDANGITVQSGDGEHPTAAVFLDGLGDADGLGIQATYDAIRIQAGMRGIIIDGKPALVCSSSTDNAVEIYGNQDVVLAGDGIIHGTIDRCTYVDSVDTIISPSWSWVTPDNGFGVVDSISTTVSVHDSTNFVDVIDDFYNGMFLQFTSGQNKGLTRLIEDFGNYGEFTVHPALPYAPAETDKFRILSLVVGERRSNIIRIVD